jgi:hypothetical protein
LIPLHLDLSFELGATFPLLPQEWSLHELGK